MRKTHFLAVLAMALLCLTGCFEVDQQYTLNPDGSGKVVHRVKKPDVMGQGAAGLKDLVKSQMTGAKGVDAWSDVSVETTEDGSMVFTGTAYFSNLNELELEDADALRFRWIPAPNGARLELVTSEAQASESELSADEVAKQLEDAKKEWNQTKPMMQGILSSFKWRASFELPGEVVDSSSFETSGGSTVTFNMSGERYFQVIEELMNDEAFLEEQARLGNLGGMSPDEAMPAEFAERLFGEGGVYAITSNGGAQFDYASAVADAEANLESMMASLPVEAPKEIVPPAKGGDFRSLKVISTGFVTDGELAWQSEGATLTIAGELPGSVVSAEEGMLNTAVSDNGTDLLPEEEWDREISVSLDSEDPTKVKFDVSTLLPPAGAKGFREVSGVVYYKNAAGPDEEVELFSTLEPGTEGSAYGAVLGDYESGYSEGSEQVSVDINLPREEISEVVFLDASGKPLDVQNVSTSWSSDSVSLTFSYDGSFPRNGSVLLKVRKDLQTYGVPFRVTNVDLTGRPMK